MRAVVKGREAKGKREEEEDEEEEEGEEDEERKFGAFAGASLFKRILQYFGIFFSFFFEFCSSLGLAFVGGCERCF